MREPIAVPDYQPLDEEGYKHVARIFKSLHTARPVMVDGKTCYVQVINSRLAGGRVETDVYLTGSNAIVDPASITIPAVLA